MKNHRLVWPLIAAVVLAFVLYAVGDGLADARPIKAGCKAKPAENVRGQNSEAMASKLCQSACTSTCLTPCQKECATACASECATACAAASSGDACGTMCSGAACAPHSSHVCGPRCRSVHQQKPACYCGKTSCRLYGIRCGFSTCAAGHRRHSAACCSGCTLECPKPCCADMAPCAPAMKCQPGCNKPCCADKAVKTVKMKCPPGCNKPCCAADGVRKMSVLKSKSCDGTGVFMRSCEGDVAKRRGEMEVYVISGDDGDRVWVQRDDDDNPRLLRGVAECDADGGRKVKRIRVKTGDPNDETVTVREMTGNEEDGGAWLGVYLQDLTSDLRKAFDLPDDLEGALVTDVVRSGPARKAGIREGFVVVQFNGTAVRSSDDLVKMVRAANPGDRVELMLNRKGDEIIRRVALDKSPQERVIIRETPGVMKRIQIDDLDMSDIDIEIPEIDVDIPEIELRGLDDLDGRIRMLRPGGAYLGVSVAELTPKQGAEYEGRGVIVNEVYDDTPAAEVGLKSGDIILEIDGEDVEGPEDLVEEIRSRDPGDVAVLYVVRGGEPMKMKAELGGREPADSMKMSPPPPSKIDANRDMMKLQQRISELEKELKRLQKQLAEKGKN